MGMPEPGRKRQNVLLDIDAGAVPPQQRLTAKACRLFRIQHTRRRATPPCREKSCRWSVGCSAIAGAMRLRDVPPPSCPRERDRRRYGRWIWQCTIHDIPIMCCFPTRRMTDGHGPQAVERAEGRDERAETR